MKTKFLFLCLLATGLTFGQSKKDMLRMLQNYSRSVVENKLYDVPEKQLWDAVYILATQEYPNLRRESESKGYIEVYLEKENYRENLTVEIRGDGPYRVAFLGKKELRHKDPAGTWTNWRDGGGFSDQYQYELQFKLYKLIYGPHSYPDDLIEKVNAYNEIQKKDKNKLIEGRDF